MHSIVNRPRKQLLLSPLRRRLLKVVAAFFLSTPALAGGATGKKAGTTANAGVRRTFAAFIDTLLPRDTYSASGTELHVDAQLWEIAKDDERFAQLLALGCQWLNMTGQAPFSRLAPSAQIAIVQWMAQSDWDLPPRRFYELVRQTAIESYYSQPATRSDIGLQAAPQPLGYPPPWQ